ncbi:integrase catalytic domain-containing protein [Trichonephila clavipes]|nr:integrase catalytic domain-containing protein [Trichonephila clavipes]
MQNIDDNLQKFWEIETINEVQKPLSKEEEYCENHYQMTHTRNEAGRSVVQMPVKDIQGLGHSKDLGHKEKVEEHFDETSANNISYYLPHHGVFRPDKTTTKRLKTVTYGTASAPFLAIRTLKQLAMNETSRFPLASKVALQDEYMDDLVSGAQNLDTARQLQCQLQNMLETCGMKLHKWNSNSKELLNSSSDQDHSFSTNAESAIKTLERFYNIWKTTVSTLMDYLAKS